MVFVSNKVVNTQTMASAEYFDGKDFQSFMDSIKFFIELYNTVKQGVIFSPQIMLYSLTMIFNFCHQWSPSIFGSICCSAMMSILAHLFASHPILPLIASLMFYSKMFSILHTLGHPKLTPHVLIRRNCPELSDKEIRLIVHKHRLLSFHRKPRKRSRKRSKLRPQSFMPAISGAELFAWTAEGLSKKALGELGKAEVFTARLEHLVSFFTAASSAKTWPAFLAVLHLYAATFTNRSVGATIIKAVKAMQWKAEGGVDEIPVFLKLVRDVRKNWRAVIKSPLFDKFSDLLSICVAAGLCEASSLDFDIKGMKIFKIQAKDKQMNAVDFVDGVLDITQYFMEGGYNCFMKGSIAPLLMSDSETANFYDRMVRITSLSTLARAGNLESIGGITEAQFDADLQDLISDCKDLVKFTEDRRDKELFSRKLSELQHIKMAFDETRISGGLRQAPWCIGIHGGSGVGKSTVANILMKLVLKSGGHMSDDKYLVTLNEADKYMSNYRSYVTGVFIDDMGNTKPNFVDKAPSRLLIDLVNNVRMYAVMPDLQMKGKVSVEPKAVIVTKNPKDGGAGHYSMEPASIARRERYLLNVEVKPEFMEHNMLSSRLVEEKFGPDFVPDCWNITVEKAMPATSDHNGGAAEVKYELLNENMSIIDVLHLCYADANEHWASQERLVKNINTFDQRVHKEVCDGCNRIHALCCCDKAKISAADLSMLYQTGDRSEWENEIEMRDANFMEGVPMEGMRAESGMEVVAAWSFFVFVMNFLGPSLMYKFHRAVRAMASWKLLEDFTMLHIQVALNWFDNNWLFLLVAIIPDCIAETTIMRRLVLYFLHTRHVSRIKYWYWVSLAIGGLLALIHWLLGFVFVTISAYILRQWMLRVIDGLYNSPNYLAMRLADYRRRYGKQLLVGTTAIGLLALIILKNRSFIKNTLSAQGNLAPTSYEEVQERDKEKNIWASAYVSPIPTTEKAKTMTPEQVKGVVASNLCHFSTTDSSGRTRWCNALFMGSNVALIPTHMFDHASSYTAEFVKKTMVEKDGEMTPVVGGKFSCVIDQEHAYEFPEVDLSLVYVPSGGDWKDISHLLPEGPITSSVVHMLHKDKYGVIEQYATRIHPGTVEYSGTNKIWKYFGANYTVKEGTFSGLCMATQIAMAKYGVIAGFHLAGNGEEGASGYITKAQYDEAFTALADQTAVLLVPSTGTLKSQQYGVTYIESTDLHPKSAVNFLPMGSMVDIYGTVTGRAKAVSLVMKSKISDGVERVCGLANKWGPPRFRQGGNNYPFQKSLVYSANAAIGVPARFLNYAVKDYHNQLRKIFAMKEMCSELRPLTRVQVVSGIPQYRFVDKVKASTSPGFPLSGRKDAYMVVEPKEDHPEYHEAWNFTPEIWEQVEEAKECIRRGERFNAIFKACLKDQPTELDSDKVRVFQSAPLVLQALIRMYFLPLARALSMFPLLSECAVGINSRSFEWQQLTDHITQHGADRILAGDYSKYDLTMPAQLILAAFKIYIAIAEEFGEYSEDDLLIMRGIAGEVAYSFMAYNGDLIRLFGSHPSGHNLTVYINSAVNSLLLRCGFAAIIGTDIEFSKVCAVTTYGDDFKGSVKVGYEAFNHISYAKFLASIGMKITMPDKTSTPTEYMNDDDADFLKRKSKFIPELDTTIGMLDEESIFKSLHCISKSKHMSEDEILGSVMDSALNEWFCHGRETYELRRSQLNEIACEHGLTLYSTFLDIPFDMMVDKWKDSYEKDRPSKSES